MVGVRMRSRAVAAVVVVLVVLALGLGGLLALQGGDDTTPDATPPTTSTTSTADGSASAEPSVEPQPVPEPAPDTSPGEETGNDRAAKRLIGPFVAADAAAREDPAQPLTLEQVATGSALEDLRAQVAELATSGVSQVGTPEVVRARVVSERPRADPPTATVRACLDYTNVDFVNPDGDSIKNPDAAQRVAVILVLEQRSRAWLVAERGYPANPTC